MSEWKTIESAPIGVRVLLWWKPVTPNPHAETCIIGSVCDGENAGKYWDGEYSGDKYQDGYKPLNRVTHWHPLPAPPATP